MVHAALKLVSQDPMVQKASEGIKDAVWFTASPSGRITTQNFRIPEQGHAICSRKLCLLRISSYHATEFWVDL